MTYRRVRPRNSKRNKRAKLDNHFNITDCCPIPYSQLKSFIEENPNSTESTQIEVFFGEPMIPVFYENEPNLINTSSEKMAEYRRQRQLIQKIKDIKKEKTMPYGVHQSSGNRFSFSSTSEPFFTALVVIKSNHKPSKDDIFNNLQHLGTIEDIVIFENKYYSHLAFVRFESSEVAFDLCHSREPIKFNYGLAKNVLVNAYPRRPLSCGGGYELLAFMRPIDRQLLIERVRNVFDFGTHFDEMKKFLLINESDRQNRLNLCQKLETILNNNQIGCKFHVFGSTVNELGFCDSDIDVFIEIFEENNLTTKMDSDVAISYLFQIREVLGKELKMYIRPIVESRRCPLIKMDFRQFGDCLRVNGISCDLSLVNSLGINNSKLIAFYCKLEPCFQTLAVVLRYLAKFNGFIGSSQMSSYAFSMLIVFFCQSISVPLLPTVEQLMQMKTKSLEINGLECGFCDDVDRYRQSFPDEWNESSINCLFELFFQFYANFDFRSRVICPRNGTVVHKTKFNSYLKDLHVTNVHDFQMTELICIQDPFDLTFNMTHHMPYKVFLELRSWFRKVSANSYEYFNDFSTLVENHRTFVDLIDPIDTTLEPIEAIKKQINETEEENDIQVIERIISKHLIAKLTINFEPNITDEDLDNQLDDWAVKVSHFFRILFREAFNEMKCLYGSQTKSKIKLNKCSTFESFIIKFKTSDRRVIDRKVRQWAENRMKEQPIDMDFIRRQTLITETIVEDSENCLIIDDNSDELRIDLELSFETNNEIYLNVTDIKPRNKSQLNQHLIDFICYTFHKGLEAEQLLTIDDDIIFL